MKTSFLRMSFFGPVAASACILGLSAISTRGDALDNWSYSQINTNPLGYIGLLVTGTAYGNGNYVAAGEFASSDFGVVQASPDGKTWAAGTNQAPGGFILDMYDVAFGNGVFAAVGWDYYDGYNIYHSTNGLSWTWHQTAIGNVYRVIYGGGLFVAVGDGVLTNGTGTTNRNIYTSPDGLTWTARNSGAPASEVGPINDVAYGAGHFVAIDGGNHFYISTTGSTWSRSTNSNGGSQISFCNNIFIVPVGSGTNALSTDGLNWTQVTNATASTFGRVIYGDGCFVALAGSKIFSSTDGTNWTQRITSISTNVALRAITYAKNRFLTVGYTPVIGSPVLPVAYFSDPTVAASINRGFPPQVTVSGLSGRSYRVEERDSLATGSWSPANTNSSGAVPFTWTDPQPANVVRFYRAVLLP
jgi:hypothetical protein